MNTPLHAYVGFVPHPINVNVYRYIDNYIAAAASSSFNNTVWRTVDFSVRHSVQHSIGQEVARFCRSLT
jgi:hypothetical protein